MSEEKQMGVISEEALDEIAGGFKVLGKDVTKADVKNVLKKAGIVIGIAGGTALLGWGGAKAYKAATALPGYPEGKNAKDGAFKLENDGSIKTRNYDDIEADDVVDMMFGKE